jgi:hypothetical protein
MNAINNNEFDKIDNFFKDHFNSMPKFNESENREKILLNTLLAQAEQKRKIVHAGGTEKVFFYSRVTDYFSNFSFLSPKYAIPMATLLVVGIAFLLIKDIKTPTEEYAKKNENKEIIVPEKKQDNPVTLEKKGIAVTPENQDLAINKTTEKQNNDVQNEVSSSDFGSISYDFTTRGSETETPNEKSLADLSISIIKDVLEQKGIKFTQKGNTIETEWLAEKEKLIKLTTNINPATKDINLKLQQKQNDNNQSYKKVEIASLKRKLEDDIFKYMNISK